MLYFSGAIFTSMLIMCVTPPSALAAINIFWVCIVCPYLALVITANLLEIYEVWKG